MHEPNPLRDAYRRMMAAAPNSAMAGCVAKLTSANKYRNQLKQSIDRVMPMREIRMIARRIEGSPDDFAVDAVTPDFPELIEWGVLLGDAIHDLRTPLDHLAWAMVIKHLEQPPPSRGRSSLPSTMSPANSAAGTS